MKTNNLALRFVLLSLCRPHYTNDSLPTACPAEWRHCFLDLLSLCRPHCTHDFPPTACPAEGTHWFPAARFFSSTSNACPAEGMHLLPAASLALWLKLVHKNAVRCIARKDGQPLPNISDTIQRIKSRVMASGSKVCIWIVKILDFRVSRVFYITLCTRLTWKSSYSTF